MTIQWQVPTIFLTFPTSGSSCRTVSFEGSTWNWSVWGFIWNWMLELLVGSNPWIAIRSPETFDEIQLNNCSIYHSRLIELGWILEQNQSTLFWMPKRPVWNGFSVDFVALAQSSTGFDSRNIKMFFSLRRKVVGYKSSQSRINLISPSKRKSQVLAMPSKIKHSTGKRYYGHK